MTEREEKRKQKDTERVKKMKSELIRLRQEENVAEMQHKIQKKKEKIRKMQGSSGLKKIAELLEYGPEGPPQKKTIRKRKTKKSNGGTIRVVVESGSSSKKRSRKPIKKKEKEWWEV